MKKKILYAAWAVMYVVCVGLGMVRSPSGLGKAALVCVAVLFFVPGAILLYDGLRQNDRKTVLCVRSLAILSLGATSLALAANFLAVGASDEAGKLWYEVLDVASAPMLCGQYWLMSLFLWACLLSASFLKGKARK